MKHNGKNIRIKYNHYPEHLNGVGGGTIDAPDEYFISVNANRIPLLQRHTIGHELAHIYLDHFERIKAWDKAPDGSEFAIHRSFEREAN